LDLVSAERKEQIVARLTAALLPRAEILEAYLFGSLARGDDQAHSDVDVAVVVADAALDQPGLGYQAEVGADLQQALARSDVDVLILNRATPLLYYSVLRDGLRIISRDLAATTRREGNALSRYCDDVPRLRRIDAIHRARIEAGEFGR
jgi:predicted nucleotidyltransferase